MINWWEIGREIVMIVIGVLVFYWGRGRKQEEDLINARFDRLRSDIDSDFELRDSKAEELRRAVDNLVKMMDHANSRSSDLTGYVQTIIGRLDRMPDELRGKFLPSDRAVDLLDESRRDRANLWKAIEDAKQDRQRLWDLIERRHRPRA